MEDLTSKFQSLLAMQGAICQPNTNTKVSYQIINRNKNLYQKKDIRKTARDKFFIV
jgi:hypothetical protein